MKFPVSRYALLVVSFLVVCLIVPASQAQTPDAAISGVVEDNSGAVIPNATVTIVSKEQGFRRVVKTNGDGLFNAPALISGRYQVTVQAKGFQTTVLDGLKLDVAATANYEFKLKVGSQDQTVTVSAGGPTINTTDASVSTVIDQQLISELPLNGRSLDTLFLLTPGVVASGTQNAGGQYSVNGQRSSGNYLTVDGASGNVFLSSTPGGGGFGTAQTGLAGSTYATSASGGTNGLLPVDAIEEYRIQTSTYSAEYGRSPGGQIQIRTRGGSNEFHGSAFEYFRNQVMDATDWFVKYDGLKQAPLRMNDFGGTLGGPILKNRLFFFGAHETLFLDQPNNLSTGVPSALALQQVSSTFAPFLAAYPHGNGGPSTTAKYPTYTDIYNAEYASQIIDHSTSARIDASLPHNYKAFFRFNIAPSSSATTVWSSTTAAINLNTYTLGLTKIITPALVNDATLNFSQNSGKYTYATLPIDGADPSGFNQFCDATATGPGALLCPAAVISGWALLYSGSGVSATQHQWNIVDTMRWSRGRHSISYGVDYRRLPARLQPYTVDEVYIGFASGPSALAGSTLDRVLTSTSKVADITIPVDNLSLFGQDDWKVTERLTVNYGLRWEYNPPISDGRGGPLAITGSVNNLAGLQVAPSYTPLYKATHANFAPRVGLAYQLRKSPGFGTTLRAGVGVFYDTGQAASTQSEISNSYPYKISALQANVPFSQLNFQSLQQSAAAQALPQALLYVVAPNLTLPYTVEWNGAIEQQLFGNTTVSATYLGAAGENLASTISAIGLAPALVTSTGTLHLLTNRGISNYQALQLQATVRTRSGIDGIVAYTYSHNIDNGSSDFTGSVISATNYRGNADDDIRHIFSAGLSFKPAVHLQTRFLNAMANGWILNTFTRIQTASPLSVTYEIDGGPENNLSGFANQISGIPVYLHGSGGTGGVHIPGGVQLNPAAFSAPPSSCAPYECPTQDGNSSRNAYRLFGLHEFDLSGGRRFAIVERVALEFKAEAFNVLNTPNFADVESEVGFPNFGQAQNTYAGWFGGLGSGGGLNTVFQSGGARNLQLTARIIF